MNTFQRVPLLINVLVLLSLGSGSAWAHNLLEVNEPGYFSTHSEPVQMLARSDAQPWGQGPADSQSQAQG